MIFNIVEVLLGVANLIIVVLLVLPRIDKLHPRKP